ncbi:hypothetical protein ACOJB1_12625 [Enterococcus innesii]|uniref:hypothetical protein n=1 Tax=Enterococcus innesii TaxID=2839759 RepID=UPI003B5A20C9
MTYVSYFMRDCGELGAAVFETEAAMIEFENYVVQRRKASCNTVSMAMTFESACYSLESGWI